MRSLLIVAVAVVVAVVSGCDADNAERRDAVSAYIRAVNRLENRSLPAFRRADEAMRSFGTSRAAAIDVRSLRAGAAATESAGAALRRITPPRDAVAIHRDLLRLFEQEAALTRAVDRPVAAPISVLPWIRLTPVVSISASHGGLVLPRIRSVLRGRILVTGRPLRIHLLRKEQIR